MQFPLEMSPALIFQPKMLLLEKQIYYVTIQNLQSVRPKMAQFFFGPYLSFVVPEDIISKRDCRMFIVEKQQYTLQSSAFTLTDISTRGTQDVG